MTKVTLTQLTKTYRDKAQRQATAVAGIDLSIAGGEFMVLVGPSGCGKSTTLRMIAGLEEVTSGTITIDQRVVNDVMPKDRDIAMVFQNYALYPHMSVFENMAFGLRLRKLPAAEIDARVRDAAALLGLTEYLERKPVALSGGQRQRVALGRAIVRKPKVFLFDEPLSNLDAKMRVAMRTEIAKLHRRLQATMIYVTHDQVEAMTMGHRICVMKDGHIMQTATPLELYHEPATLFVAGFIGSPPMNFFRGTLGKHAEAVQFVATETAMRATVSRAWGSALGTQTELSVVLGIRPEDLRVSAVADQPASFSATVEVVEPMGAETYLYLRSSDVTLVARVNPTETFAPGDKVSVGFTGERMHFFDAATERRLIARDENQKS